MKIEFITFEKQGILNKNSIGADILDSVRAKQILESTESIQVLYEGSPVWLESIGENNIATATKLDSSVKIEVPVYMLVEKNPVNRQ
jgi:H-type small acid-soluble spore protein